MHPIVTDPDPKEQVGNPANVVSEALILPSQKTTPSLSEASHDSHEIEVTSEPICDVPVDVDDSVPSTGKTCRYELPSRRTRGVPPK